jgi:hypothetical protein
VTRLAAGTTTPRNRDKALARVKAARPPVVSREVVCPGCGEPFMAIGRQRYCKPECRPTGDRGAKVRAVCEHCGREFTARARDRQRGGGRYCSKSCGLRDRARKSRADAPAAAVPECPSRGCLISAARPCGGEGRVSAPGLAVL